MSKPGKGSGPEADEIAEEIAKTVKLATGALDHPDGSDEELEKLREDVLSDKPRAAKEPKRRKTSG